MLIMLPSPSGPNILSAKRMRLHRLQTIATLLVIFLICFELIPFGCRNSSALCPSEKMQIKPLLAWRRNLHQNRCRPILGADNGGRTAGQVQSRNRKADGGISCPPLEMRRSPNLRHSYKNSVDNSLWRYRDNTTPVSNCRVLSHYVSFFPRLRRGSRNHFIQRIGDDAGRAGAF